MFISSSISLSLSLSLSLYIYARSYARASRALTSFLKLTFFLIMSFAECGGVMEKWSPDTPQEDFKNHQKMIQNGTQTPPSKP